MSGTTASCLTSRRRSSATPTASKEFDLDRLLRKFAGVTAPEGRDSSDGSPGDDDHTAASGAPPTTAAASVPEAGTTDADDVGTSGDGPDHADTDT